MKSTLLRKIVTSLVLASFAVLPASAMAKSSKPLDTKSTVKITKVSKETKKHSKHSHKHHNKQQLNKHVK
jgi:hypothetical protein